MNEIRNILLFGRTGSGKSTLGNVLVNRNGNFTEVFKESSASISETKDIQVETFNVDSGQGRTITYRVIDIIGIGDTKLNAQEVLVRLGKIAEEIKQGLSQILFVTDGRFTEAETKAFQVLSRILFDEDVFDYTTIARSNFANFRDGQRCNEDIQSLRGNNPVALPIINRIKRGNIVYVNNPPLTGGRRDEIASEERTESRGVLLSHLEKKQETYKPESIGQMVDNIQKHLDKEKEEREKAEKRIEELRKKIDKSANEHKVEVNQLNHEIAKDKAEHEQKVNKMNQEIADLKKRNDALIAAGVAEQANNKLTLYGMMEKGTAMVERGATVGADIGSRVFPGIGNAGGGLIGAGVGFTGAMVATGVYLLSIFTGKGG